eukprot:SAG11_NODE_12509_length_699_cov_1.805000_2_plen_96_part_01
MMVRLSARPPARPVAIGPAQSWHMFMNMRSSDATKSWHAFFDEESDLFANADMWQRLNLIMRNVVWLILAVLIFLNKFALLDVPNTEGSVVVPAMV